MVTWGIISACTMFVQRAAELLRRALPARHRRGRLLPRHDPLPLATGSRRASAPAPSASSCRRSRSPTRSARRSRAAIMSVFGGVAGLEDWQWLFLHRGDPGDRSPASSCWLLPRRRPASTRRWLAAPTRSAGWRERLEGEEAARTAARAPLDRRGAQGPPRARVRPPVLLHGRQRLRPVVLGRRDRRQDRRAERRRQGLRDRDPVHGRDRRPRADLAPLRPHRRAQAATSAIPLAIAAVAFAVSHGRLARSRRSRRSPSACSSCSARTPCSGRCPRRCSAAPPRRRGSR